MSNTTAVQQYCASCRKALGNAIFWHQTPLANVPYCSIDCLKTVWPAPPTPQGVPSQTEGEFICYNESHNEQEKCKRYCGMGYCEELAHSTDIDIEKEAEADEAPIHIYSRPEEREYFQSRIASLEGEQKWIGSGELELKLSEKDAEIQRKDLQIRQLQELLQHKTALGEAMDTQIGERDAEIQTLKSELALHEKWKNDTLNDLVTYKAHKDKEIQELKEELEHEKNRYQSGEEGTVTVNKLIYEALLSNTGKYQQEIQHLKSSRVKDIEDTWDAALAALGKIHERHQGDKLMPKEQAKFIASLMEKDLEKEKSSYLKPFTADSK